MLPEADVSALLSLLCCPARGRGELPMGPLSSWHLQLTMGTFWGTDPLDMAGWSAARQGAALARGAGGGGDVTVLAPSLPPQTIQGIQAKCFRNLPDLIGAYQQPNNGLVTPLLYPVHRARQAADEDSGELGRGQRGPHRAASGEGGVPLSWLSSARRRGGRPRWQACGEHGPGRGSWGGHVARCSRRWSDPHLAAAAPEAAGAGPQQVLRPCPPQADRGEGVGTATPPSRWWHARGGDLSKDAYLPLQPSQRLHGLHG